MKRTWINSAARRMNKLAAFDNDTISLIIGDGDGHYTINLMDGTQITGSYEEVEAKLHRDGKHTLHLVVSGTNPNNEELPTMWLDDVPEDD